MQTIHARCLGPKNKRIKNNDDDDDDDDDDKHNYQLIYWAAHECLNAKVGQSSEFWPRIFIIHIPPRIGKIGVAFGGRASKSHVLLMNDLGHALMHIDAEEPILHRGNHWNQYIGFLVQTKKQKGISSI